MSNARKPSRPIPEVSISDEVAQHHIDTHFRAEHHTNITPFGWTVTCPCDAGCGALMCGLCEGPIIVALYDPDDPCEHAVELLDMTEEYGE